MNSKFHTLGCAIATLTIVGLAGYQSIRSLLRRNPTLAAKSIQKWFRNHQEIFKENELVVTVQCHVRGYCARRHPLLLQKSRVCISKSIKSLSTEKIEDISALLIQSWWRTNEDKPKYMTLIPTKIQDSFIPSSILYNFFKMKAYIVTMIIAKWWKTVIKIHDENEIQEDEIDIRLEGLTSCDRHQFLYDNLAVVQSRMKGFLERVKCVEVKREEKEGKILGSIDIWWKQSSDKEYSVELIDNLLSIQDVVKRFAEKLRLIRELEQTEKEMASIILQAVWRNYKSGESTNLQLSCYTKKLKTIHKFMEDVVIPKNDRMKSQQTKSQISNKLAKQETGLEFEFSENGTKSKISHSSQKIHQLGMETQSISLIRLLEFKSEFLISTFEFIQENKNVPSDVIVIQSVIRRFLTKKIIKNKKEQINEKLDILVQWWKDVIQKSFLKSVDKVKGEKTLYLAKSRQKVLKTRKSSTDATGMEIYASNQYREDHGLTAYLKHLKMSYDNIRKEIKCKYGTLTEKMPVFKNYLLGQRRSMAFENAKKVEIVNEYHTNLEIVEEDNGVRPDLNVERINFVQNVEKTREERYVAVQIPIKTDMKICLPNTFTIEEIFKTSIDMEPEYPAKLRIEECIMVEEDKFITPKDLIISDASLLQPLPEIKSGESNHLSENLNELKQLAENVVEDVIKVSLSFIRKFEENKIFAISASTIQRWWRKSKSKELSQENIVVRVIEKDISIEYYSEAVNTMYLSKTKNIKTIQFWWRSRMQRKEYLQTLSLIVYLQALIRGYNVRRYLNLLSKQVLKMAAKTIIRQDEIKKMSLGETEIKIKSIKIINRVYTSSEEKEIKIIQNYCRSIIQRGQYRRTLSFIIHIQVLIRGYIHRYHFNIMAEKIKLLVAKKIIENWWKKITKKREINIPLTLITKPDDVAREESLRGKFYEENKEKIIVIQTLIRCHSTWLRLKSSVTDMFHVILSMMKDDAILPPEELLDKEDSKNDKSETLKLDENRIEFPSVENKKLQINLTNIKNGKLVNHVPKMETGIANKFECKISVKSKENLDEKQLNMRVSIGITSQMELSSSRLATLCPRDEHRNNVDPEELKEESKEQKRLNKHLLLTFYTDKAAKTIQIWWKKKLL
ncbi:protein Daple-like isoform X2 [Centruroides vittatus]|uniref:protein Daple-like isoform X2 n=1 Tax=Centruroides vittatus TaxID=120091 RepID=UPI0035100A37